MRSSKLEQAKELIKNKEYKKALLNPNQQRYKGILEYSSLQHFKDRINIK